MSSPLQLFANAGDGVFAVDQEQRILFWNDLAQKTLGHSSQEAVGKYCWELLNGKSEAGIQICCPNCPIFQRIRKQLPVESFNLLVKHRNGQTIKLNVSSIGLPSNGDDIVGLAHVQRET